jgi:glutamyl-tRNA reductase
VNDANEAPIARAQVDAPPLLIAGLALRSAGFDLRDAFARIEADLGGALESLAAAGLRDGVLIATCDRVELVSHDAAAPALLVPLVAARAAAPESALAPALYRHEGDAALKHLFAVASALESAVIGEPHVLGQVRAAHREAAGLGLVGAALEASLLAALACARRVRRETGLSESPQSIAAAAIDLARGIHGDLSRTAALLLGPAEMGELLAEQFHRVGLARLAVCGPTERASRAAERLACHFAPYDDLPEALASADIVISSIGSGRVALSHALVAAALRKRPLRPIFVIDVASPTDADPAINELDGVFLYDLADLERAALTGRANRAAAADAAWRIVAEELAGFAARRAARAAVPAVVALRRHFEKVRDEVMRDRSLDAETATRLLVARLLHAPSQALRALAGEGGDAARAEELLRRLFRLGAEDE